MFELSRIAVIKGERGQGGSEYIHRVFTKGQELVLQGPRNHFALNKSNKYIFIAGGIGITPVRAKIEEAEAQQSDYEVLYLGSDKNKMAYADELFKNPRAEMWNKATQGPCDLEQFFAGRDLTDSLVYCCGPARLMLAVEQLFDGRLPSSAVHVERFTNALASSDLPNQPVDVTLGKSNRAFLVLDNRSFLEVLHENGVHILFTCTKGTCGTCEIGVLDGVPDRRDTVLTREEKAVNKYTMVCVSRCKGSKLTLDLR